MSIDQSQRQSYATMPEAAYYPEYQVSSLSSEPVGGVFPQSDVPQPHYHASQPAWYSASKLQPEARGKVTPLQRLILAIFSVNAAALFSMIIMTSTQNDSSAGLIGTGIMCGAILLINAVFNRPGN